MLINRIKKYIYKLNKIKIKKIIKFLTKNKLMFHNRTIQPKKFKNNNIKFELKLQVFSLGIDTSIKQKASY